MKSVSVLVGGTALAQLVAIAVLPILTRLYSPEDFSVLAAYVAALTILSSAACLRFDAAIPLPESETDSIHLLILSVISCVIVSTLLLVIVLVAPELVISIFRGEGLEGYFWILPFGVLFVGLYNSFQFLATRLNKFPAIARTKLSQAVIGSGMQISAGVMTVGTIGLLGGHLVYSCAGVFSLAFSCFKGKTAALKNIRLKKLRSLVKEYHHFPKYSTLEVLANNAGIHLPIILIASYSVGPEAGYVMLAMKVMQVPISLVGGAVGQVYLSKAAGADREGELDLLTKRTVRGLLKVGIAPLVIAGCVAPFMFSFIFGESWNRAGDLITWMTPWFIMQFISSPISTVMHVKGFQRAMLFLTGFGLLLRVGAIFFAYLTNPTFVVEAYAVSGFVFYSVCFFVFLNAAGVRIAELKRSVT